MTHYIYTNGVLHNIALGLTHNHYHYTNRTPTPNIHSIHFATFYLFLFVYKYSILFRIYHLDGDNRENENVEKERMEVVDILM